MKKNERMTSMNKTNCRILGKNITVSNDTYLTHLNNNDLIIGPSGSGKTTSYIIPNLVHPNGSYIIADTKGNLYNKYHNHLEQQGYTTKLIDFTNLRNSCSYNPLDYIEYYSETEYNEQDIIKLSSIICPIETQREPFWETSAQTALTSLIAFVIENAIPEERNLVSVTQLFKMVNSPDFERLILLQKERYPESFAVKSYYSFKNVANVEKTWGCISQFLSNALRLFDLRESKRVFCGKADFDFETISTSKYALFVNVSDTDRSMDKIVNIFYTQTLQALCRIADHSEGSRLKVPVRIFLDDFATNTYIPDFDKIISVIRSREISVSIILQSLSQLDSLYNHSQAKTIKNNCDHIIYLGGQDIDTAKYISTLTDKCLTNILQQKLNDTYLITRGQKTMLINKIAPETYAPNCFNNGRHIYCAPTKDSTSLDSNQIV